MIYNIKGSKWKVTTIQEYAKLVELVASQKDSMASLTFSKLPAYYIVNHHGAIFNVDEEDYRRCPYIIWENIMDVEYDPLEPAGVNLTAKDLGCPEELTATEEYFQFAEKRAETRLELSRKKNADYTGGNEDPFHNFTMVEELEICDTEVGFLVRMTDKLCRISSLLTTKEQHIKSESVDDTLLDLANYADLLAGYLALKKRKEE